MTAALGTATAHPLDESTLRGMLAQFDRRRDGSRLLIVDTPGAWEGPEVLETDAGMVRVVVGRSVLAVRAAMAEHPDEALVVLTLLPLGELGDEVRARAWKQRVHRPSPWDAVKALFRVEDLDPSLRDERWMVDLLVQLAPARGYAQPMSQVLDRATAWRNLYRYGLQLTVDSPSTADVLGWSATPAAATALTRLGEEQRQRVGEHLAVVAGPAAPTLVRLAAEGRGGDAVALGLVIDALWPDCDPGARVLLQERHLGQQALGDGAALDWGRAAVAAVHRGPGDGEPMLARAGELLAEIDQHGVGDSDVLDATFPRRLAALGRVLTSVLDEGRQAGFAAADTAMAAVAGHVRTAREPGRVERARAALRLSRRAVAAAPPQDGGQRLADLADRYLAEGAWVDAARHRLAEGESVPELVAVFERLLGLLDGERATRDRTFAAAVAAEAAIPGVRAAGLAASRLLAIEDVLGTVLAPLARSQPVLLLVIDGLPHAAAVPLLEDLRREGWVPHGPAGADLPPVVAALPTVTVVSRASLLTGRLQRGGPDVEREGFTSHPDLRDAAAGQAPVLFHKADLRPADGEIAAGVREVVADADRRVVGVVVNGVDDFLGGGDQLRLADGLEGIPVLRPVLDAASEARRVVVVVSDHGHILGSRQRVVAAPGGGERFRPPGTTPASDEVEVAGGRVFGGGGLGAEQRVVLAAEEGVRYVAYAKHGYHGGATPAEVLCPLAVLVRGGAAPEGWEPLVLRAPAWWDPSLAPVAVPPEVAATPAPARAPAPQDGQLSLLAPDAPLPAGPPAWLAALLASPRLAAQHRLAGRVALDDHDLGVLLRILVASGGTVSGAALQRTLDLPASRLRGKLEAARTLLDVDGYQVLRIEADGTAALNAEQLARQFEIPAPGGSQ